MITIRQERAADAAAREALLDAAYGPVRFTKPSERIRRGRIPADGLALVATDGRRIVGTVRLWNVAAGGRAALLLGPLAVDPAYRCRGIGASLVARAMDEAAKRRHPAVLLVGDAAYYGRFGFSAEKTGMLRLAGLDQPQRLLACELTPPALDGAAGLIVATGTGVPKPRRGSALTDLLGGLTARPRRLAPRAA